MLMPGLCGLECHAKLQTFSLDSAASRQLCANYSYVAIASYKLVLAHDTRVYARHSAHSAQ